MMLEPSDARGSTAASLAVTDEELVSRVRTGHLAAFAELMHRHGRLVFRIVRSLVRDDADAAGACEDAWLRAHAELDRLPETAAFSTWIARLALRDALARLPEHRGLASLHGLDRDAPDVGEADYDGRAQPGTSVEAIERAIDGMRPSYATVVVLRYVESLTSREIAEILGLGEQNVRMRLDRARAYLRERLADEIGLAMRDAFRFAENDGNALVGAVMRGVYGTLRAASTRARSQTPPRLAARVRR